MVVLVVVVEVEMVVVEVVVVNLVGILLLMQSLHSKGHVYSRPVGQPMLEHSLASIAIEQLTF